ncbi:P-loop containing nucleoside triphosphate hydrolase protein, partial [Lyophyllum atratum]
MEFTSHRDVDITNLAEQWTLNTDQKRAFQMIANQALLNKPEKPLILYIAGQAGTGKTRIIKALSDFFQRRDEVRRFRLTSFMGAAARNISGVTIHSALAFGVNNRSKEGSTGHRHLVDMWDGVDFIFIDEISMIGCHFLWRISDALA